MFRISSPRIGHVHEIEIGPPLLKPAPKLVRQPARIEMIENEIAKFENPDQDRFSSCAYPRRARCFSSSVRCGTSCSSMGSCASGMCHTFSGGEAGFIGG